MTPAQIEQLVELLSDPKKAEENLPIEEREAYKRAQESVVEARRRVWIDCGHLYIGAT